MLWKKLKKFNKKKETDLKEEIEQNGGLEKNDLSAMTIAALVTILPVCLLVLVVISVLGMWAFGAFG